MEKKIALIIERTDTSLGGAERSVNELAESLTELGNKVEILAAKGKNSANTHILCDEYIGKRIPLDYFGKKLSRFLSMNKYSIIHSVLPFEFADIYQPRGGTYAEALIRNADSYESGIMKWFKNKTSLLNNNRYILLKAEEKLCRNSDGPHVAALSEYVANQFIKHYNLPYERMSVIPNGVKIRKHIDPNYTIKLRSEMLCKAGISEQQDPVLYLFAANNFRLKGLNCLIRAMHLVEKLNKRCYIVVAGNDNPSSFKKYASKFNVKNKLIFIGEIKDIEHSLFMCDAAVLPTFYDPASRFILEALVADKPVITTKYNGAAEMFDNNRHGIVIDNPQNIQSLADAIIHYSNINHRHKSSKAIIDDKLDEKISITRAAKELDCLYDKIIEGRTK